MLDRSGGTDANTGRVGYFSDIYYDPARGHWWALSDRGPGGGALHYETRVQRFRLKIDRATGAISGFKILKTVIFKDESRNPLDGIAPNPTNVLGNAFDPEGFVVHPKTGHFLVSDEYGPSLYEFNRRGMRVRTFTIPANLIPRNAATDVPELRQRRWQHRRQTHQPRLRGVGDQPRRRLRLCHAAKRHARRGRRQRRVQPHRQVRHQDR